MSNKKRYYPKLDVMRTISCIAVFLYHFGLLKGGYLAVCTFFVLSGYLSCLSFFRQEKFSFYQYYKNRFFHIYLPLCVVVFSSIFAISFFPDINFLNLKPETTSVLLGYNNFWQLQANLDYFARHVDSPFMHFWYIAILLQFELVFPFLFLFFKKLGKKTKTFVPCILLGILSLISSFFFVYMSYHDSIMTVYYHTFTRAFSIFFGLFLGFFMSYYSNGCISIFSKKPYSTFIFYTYSLILILFYLLIPADSPFFCLIMILTSIISCRLISYGTIEEKDSLSLIDSVIKYFSSISYEIYLVQYPIIFLLQYVSLSFLSKISFTIAFTLISAFLLHFALSISKKNKLYFLQLLLCILLLGVSIPGAIQFVQAKDHTEEMKQLEEQLTKNQKLMAEKQKAYASKVKEEEEYWNSLWQDFNEESIEKLKEYVHSLSVIGVGDSVMLGAISDLYEQFPNGYFDAKVSRTDYEANGILQEIRSHGSLGDIILINLGTNGQCGTTCQQAILQTCEGRKVFWITVTNDQDVHVNNGLKSLANQNDNVYLIDWNSISSGHSEYFIADGIHLTGAGRIAYSNAIYDSIYQVYLNEYNQKKEQLANEYEKVRNQKIIFYGNELLLNSFEEIQNILVDYQIDFELTSNEEFDIVLDKLIEQSKSVSFPKNIVFLPDSTFSLNDSQYQKLSNLNGDFTIYYLSFQALLYPSSEQLQFLDFSKEIQNHPNYFMADRIHLSKEGNDALVQYLATLFEKKNQS